LAGLVECGCDKLGVRSRGVWNVWVSALGLWVWGRSQSRGHSGFLRGGKMYRRRGANVIHR
jgi:hypothetical protein